MLTSKILPHRQKPVSMAELDPGLRGPQEILRTGQFVVPRKGRAVRGISGTIFAKVCHPSFPQPTFTYPLPAGAHSGPCPSPSPPPGAERAGVRWGKPERLPMPTPPSRFAGPSLSPLKGEEGVLETRVTEMHG